MKRLAVAGLLAAISFGSLASLAFGAQPPRAGNACKPAGRVAYLEGKKFTCLKSGKKLVWSKGIVPSKPKKSQAAEPIPTSPPLFLGPVTRAPYEYLETRLFGRPAGAITSGSEVSPVDHCRIETGDASVRFTSGFPVPTNRAQLTGPLKVQILPVDFPDVPGTIAPRDEFKTQIQALTDFWSKSSTRPVQINIDSPDRYIRMKRSVLSYGLTGDFFAGTFDGDAYWRYVREAITTADPVIDFSGTDVLIVLTPKSVTKNQIGTFVVETEIVFETDEGRITNVLIRGNGTDGDSDRVEVWNWIHEFGHTLGLTDIRNVMDPGNQSSAAMGIFDVMSAPSAPELLVWHRFLLGMITDEQIRCVQTTDRTSHWIVPVESESSLPKGVVIPLSKTSAIVIESRRRMGFDSLLGTASEGALVYTLDTTIPYGMSPINVIPKATSSDLLWRRDAPLHPGDFIEVGGWRISCVEAGPWGDLVLVEHV